MLVLMAGCSKSAPPSEGGTLAWKGKEADDVKGIMAGAKTPGRAMMLFFSSEG
jgi:hypothetical protein